MLMLPSATEVPFWALSGLVFGPTVALHYLLLRQPSVSNELLTIIVTPLAVLLPMAFYSEVPLWNVMMSVTSQVFLLLKLLEAGTIPRDVNSKWSFHEYLEFLATSDNRSLRAIAARKAEKEELLRKEQNLPPLPKKWKPYSPGPADRGVVFYLGFIVRCVITFVVYVFARSYLEKYGFESRFGFMNLLDTKAVVDHMAFSAMVYCTLDLCYMVSSLSGAILLQTPLVYMFNHPYFATSLRDFWSFRWNYSIKETLHRLGFQQTLQLLELVNPPKASGPRAKPLVPPLHFAIASMGAFLMSGLLHEWMLFLYMPHEVHGENLCFFLLQGVLTYIQLRLQQETGFGKTWGNDVFGAFVGWFCSMFFLMIMSPLFIGPYARSGFLMNDFKLPVPSDVVEHVKLWI